MMTNTAADVAVLLDSSANPYDPDYSSEYGLKEIWRLESAHNPKIQVVIRVSANRIHCAANAQTITGNVPIHIDEPVSTWLSDVPAASEFRSASGVAPLTVEDVHEVLDPLVNKLVTRMAAIL